MSKQEIRVGQVWERIADGARVRITAYRADWDDTSYRYVDGRRGGDIYAYYLRARYRLIEDAA